MRRLLFENATVVTMNDDFDVVEGHVIVEDDRIAAVGPGAAPAQNYDETIDATGRLLTPGFIQPHIHLCQTLFRGYADDLALLEWLGQRIWPFEAGHTPESLYCSSMLGGAELLRGGTTAILDMGTVRHTDAIFKAAMLMRRALC